MTTFNTHSEICPVCKGSGKYRQYPTTDLTVQVSYIETVCHGCSGTGWIVVPDENVSTIK